MCVFVHAVCVFVHNVFVCVHCARVCISSPFPQSILAGWTGVAFHYGRKITTMLASGNDDAASKKAAAGIQKYLNFLLHDDWGSV